MNSARGSGASRPISAWALVLVLTSAGGTGMALGQLPSGSSTPNEFHLDITAGERSNSNAFFDPVDGTPRQDYVGTLSANLTARRSSPRTDWSLGYSPFISRYQTYSELDSASHSFNFAGSYQLGPKGTLALRENFSLSNDPIVVAAPEEGEAPILTNASRVLNSRSEVQYQHQMTRRVGMVTSANYILHQYADSALQDSSGALGMAGLNFELGREDSMGVTYTLGRLQYEEEGLADVTSHQFAVGWEHAVQERSRIEITAGSTIADQNERQRLFTGSVTYQQRFGRSVNVGGGWRRSLTADTGSNGVAVGDRIFATISGRAGRHLSWMGSADYGTRESVAGAGTPINLDLYGGSLRGTYSFGTRWGLVAGASLRRQENRQPSTGAQNVNNYFVGVSCRAF